MLDRYETNRQERPSAGSCIGRVGLSGLYSKVSSNVTSNSQSAAGLPHLATPETSASSSQKQTSGQRRPRKVTIDSQLNSSLDSNSPVNRKVGHNLMYNFT